MYSRSQKIKNAKINTCIKRFQDSGIVIIKLFLSLLLLLYYHYYLIVSFKCDYNCRWYNICIRDPQKQTSLSCHLFKTKTKTSKHKSKYYHVYKNSINQKEHKKKQQNKTKQNKKATKYHVKK